MTKTLIRPLPALVAAMLAPAAAQAVEFAAGGWNGSFDTTVSFGQTWRVEQSRDPRLIATANGGTGRSPNIDDGNLNYRKGRVSSAYKMVAELSLDRGENFGVFVRGSAPVRHSRSRTRAPNARRSPRNGKDLAGSYAATARRLRVRPLGPRGSRARRPRRPPGRELGREHLHPGRHQRRDQPLRRFRAARPGVGAARGLPAAGVVEGRVRGH